MNDAPNPHYYEAPYEEATWDPENGAVKWKETAKRKTDEEVIYTLKGSNGKERELRLPRKFTP